MSTLCYSCGNNPDDIGHEPDCYVPLEEMQKRAERAEAHIAQLEADVGAIRYANAMQERAERAETRVAMLESQEWFVVRSLEADKVRLAAALREAIEWTISGREVDGWEIALAQRILAGKP